MAGCYDCHEPYDSPRFHDLLIPTYIWNQISPTGGEGGLLCPGCIMARLEAKGFDNVPSFFASGPLCMGDAGTPVWIWKERLLRLEELVEGIRNQVGREL